MSCLLGVKHNMYIDVEEYVYADEDPDTLDTPTVDQDPISGGISRPNTDNASSDWRVVKSRVPALVRGIITSGIGTPSTTEKYSETYNATDWVRIWTKYSLNRNQRITNVRDKKGNIIWLEEEQNPPTPTIFNINGMTPTLGPFGELIEYTGLGERAAVQV